LRAFDPVENQRGGPYEKRKRPPAYGKQTPAAKGGRVLGERERDPPRRLQKRGRGFKAPGGWGSMKGGRFL